VGHKGEGSGRHFQLSSIEAWKESGSRTPLFCLPFSAPFAPTSLRDILTEDVAKSFINESEDGVLDEFPKDWW